jgi:putative RNA 2'-phosphotransferase
MKLKQAEQLAHFLAYMLGRRPDEFGMVTDPEGFVPLAEVLQALQEEGWPQVRRNHLEVLNYHLGREVLDLSAHLVRAADRSRLAEIPPAEACPKVLYAAVRRRAYDAVAQHGLRPQGHTGRVVLFADRELARRSGRRRDAEPVLVTVNAASARDHGCALAPFGAAIFLTDAVPPACCRLPRAPQPRPRREPAPPAAPQAPKTPGSFLLDPGAQKREPRSGVRDKDWKRQRQKARRWKHRGGDTP